MWVLAISLLGLFGLATATLLWSARNDSGKILLACVALSALAVWLVAILDTMAVWYGKTLPPSLRDKYVMLGWLPFLFSGLHVLIAHPKQTSEIVVRGLLAARGVSPFKDDNEVEDTLARLLDGMPKKDRAAFYLQALAILKGRAPPSDLKESATPPPLRAPPSESN